MFANKDASWRDELPAVGDVLLATRQEIMDDILRFWKAKKEYEESSSSSFAITINRALYEIETDTDAVKASQWEKVLNATFSPTWR